MSDPILILAATPQETSIIKDMFQSEKNSVKELLRNPGEIRYAGWDLNTLDNPKIIKGQCWEVRNADRKILDLYEDGTFIFRASAGGEFLGWPKKEEEFNKHPRLNPMAIIEVTYNFVSFYARLVEHFEKEPEIINFRIELKNLFLKDTKVYMLPYGLNSYPWMFGDERYPAPETEMIWNLEEKTNFVVNSTAHMAFKIVERIYLWFGLEASKIPYTSTNDQGRYINIEEIKKK